MEEQVMTPFPRDASGVRGKRWKVTRVVIDMQGRSQRRPEDGGLSEY